MWILLFIFLCGIVFIIMGVIGILSTVCGWVSNVAGDERFEREERRHRETLDAMLRHDCDEFGDQNYYITDARQVHYNEYGQDARYEQLRDGTDTNRRKRQV